MCRIKRWACRGLFPVALGRREIHANAEPQTPAMQKFDNPLWDIRVDMYKRQKTIERAGRMLKEIELMEK